MRPGRFLVFGAGAIGAAVGGLIAKTSREVVFIQRGEHGRRIREHGLYLATCAGSDRLRIPCVETLEQAAPRDDDEVWVGMKLGDAQAAYAALAKLADCRVLVGQNGVHGLEWAREHFSRVVPTMVWVPSELLEPGEVRVYGSPVPGRIDVGPDAEDVRDQLRKAGFQAEVREPFEPWMHAKWLTNLGGIAHRFGVPEQAEALMEEGRQILDATGTAHCFDALIEAVEHIDLIQIDGRDRTAGGSSVHGARRGRASEARWLNGALVALASRHGLEAPLNHAFLERDRGGEGPATAG